MLNPRQFYAETLKRAGFTPPDPQFDKVAALKGVDVNVVKLAEEFNTQLQFDKAPYESEVARAEDALKLAKAYFDHVKAAEDEATKTADGILRFLDHELEGYLAKNNIPLLARDALKIAALQADTTPPPAKTAAPAQPALGAGAAHYFRLTSAQ